LDSKNWDKRKLKPKESLLSLEAVVSARDAKEWQAEPQPPRPFAPSPIGPSGITRLGSWKTVSAERRAEESPSTHGLVLVWYSKLG